MVAIVTGVHLRHSLSLIRDLGEAGIDVIAVSRKGDGVPMGFHSKWVHETHLLPEEGFLKELYSICNDIRVGYGCKPALMVCDRKTLRLLAEGDAISCFKNVAGYEGSPIDVLQRLGDKEESNALCRELGVPIPRQSTLKYGTGDYSDAEVLGYPCFLKLIDGEKFGLFAPQRIRKVRDPEEMHMCAEQMFAMTKEDIVVQEFLPGDLVTYNFYASEGKVLAHNGQRAVRTYPRTGGVPCCIESYESEELVGYATRIIEHCKFSGLFCIQFMADRDGNMRFIEINPRMYGDYNIDRWSKSQMSLHWFASLWNQANENKFNVPVVPKVNTRNYAFPADIISAADHLLHGEPAQFADSVHNFFRKDAHERGVDVNDLGTVIPSILSMFDRHLIRKHG